MIYLNALPAPAEDIGAGDITAMLIPEQQQAKAEIIFANRR